MPGSKGLKLTQRGDIWYVRGTVRGKTIYESTETSDKGTAEGYRALREAELWRSSVFGEKATVTYTHALASFQKTKTISPSDADRHLKLLNHFRTWQVNKIDQSALDRAYEVLLPTGASNANKLRTVLAPLRVVLNHAARRGWCDKPDFEIPPQNEPRVAFLRPQQAALLLQVAARHLGPLLAFLLFNGCRMSEALELDWADVDLFGSVVVFRKTKNGRERHYRMPPASVASLSTIEHREGPVFLTSGIKKKDGDWAVKPAPYYNNGRQAGGQIKTAWATACKAAGITGFTPHDLRHTWATWHYCQHKDLLRLRDEGGWKTADQVEIYAHKMPDAYLPQIKAMLAGAPAQHIAKEA